MFACMNFCVALQSLLHQTDFSYCPLGVNTEGTIQHEYGVRLSDEQIVEGEKFINTALAKIMEQVGK